MRRLVLYLLAASILLQVSVARAESFPTRTVQLIVPESCRRVERRGGAYAGAGA